jgi:hypothetical protein
MCCIIFHKTYSFADNETKVSKPTRLLTLCVHLPNLFMVMFSQKGAVTCFQVSSQNLLSPTGNSNQQRRPSSVMFSDVVLFHGGVANENGETTRNVCSSEKMTQTGDDNLWPVLGSTGASQQIGTQQQVGTPDVQPVCEGGDGGGGGGVLSM